MGGCAAAVVLAAGLGVLPSAAPQDAEPQDQARQLAVQPWAAPVAGALAAVPWPLWGLVAGAGAGVWVTRQAYPEGTSAGVYGVMAVGGSAGLGMLAALPAALIFGALADTTVWLWGHRHHSSGVSPAAGVAHAVLLATGAGVLALAGAAAGLALMVRAPQGGLARDPAGSLLVAGAVAGGVVVLLGVPALVAAWVVREVLWRRLPTRTHDT